MRRRRQHLQVSTFPFLAVLLCAMGSLILVLLSMDRTAKKAALARAQEEANETVRVRNAEHEKLVAQRHREHEGKKRAQRQAWEKKGDALHARVQTEEQALQKELALVQARLAEAARKLREEEGGLEELGKQLEREKALLAKQQQAVDSARRDAAGAARQLTASDQARARLSAELARLEKTLADQLERRKKDAHTYSVIPYHGKRGEGRRPVYVECSAAGHVFHPDRKTLTRSDDLRGELRARVEAQKERLKAAGEADLRPYVMLLVRPDGAGRYYEMQAAARDVGVEFGYEFVEADWVLHFPEEDAPKQPWMVSAPPPVSGGAGKSNVRGVPASPGHPQAHLAHGGEGDPVGEGKRGDPNAASGQGVPGAGGGQVGRGGGSASAHASGKPAGDGSPGGGTGNAGGGIGIGAPLLPGDSPRKGESGGVALGSGPARTGGGNEGATPGLFPQVSDGIPELPPRIDTPSAILSAPTPGKGVGSGQTASAGRSSGGPSLGGGDAGSANPGNVDGNLNPGVGPAPVRPGGREGIEAPSLVRNFSGETDPVARVPGRGPAVATSDTKPEKSEPRIGPSLPEPPDGTRKPPSLRPARLDGGESIVFVECKSDMVIIHPSRKRVAIESLNHSPAYNQLVQTVRQQVQRRQAHARAGEPVKVQVRFLVHRDGEKTFHLAYPALEALRLPMTRYGLQAWDDVSRIVAEY